MAAINLSPINISYVGQAPVASGSTILAVGGSSMQELAYIGTVTLTGDGSGTSAVINYTNGTANGLGFTPTAVSVVRVGGNAANSIVVYAADNADNTAVVTFSAAPGNQATVKLAVVIYK